MKYFNHKVLQKLDIDIGKKTQILNSSNFKLIQSNITSILILGIFNILKLDKLRDIGKRLCGL